MTDNTVDYSAVTAGTCPACHGSRSIPTPCDFAGPASCNVAHYKRCPDCEEEDE